MLAYYNIQFNKRSHGVFKAVVCWMTVAEKLLSFLFYKDVIQGSYFFIKLKEKMIELLFTEIQELPALVKGRSSLLSIIRAYS